MGPFAIVEGVELSVIMDVLADAVARREGVYKITVCVDGGLKIKVNEGMWTPAYGREVDSY